VKQVSHKFLYKKGYLPERPGIDVSTRVARLADYCAMNAAAIDRTGAFPVQEFDMIRDLGLLAAECIPLLY
jgi:hypothetical protein